MDTRRLLTIAALIAAALTTRATDYVVEPGVFTIEQALQQARLDRLHNSQFTINNSQFTIHNSQFPIPNSQFTIPNSQSSIPNSQSSILNSQFTIRLRPGVYRLTQPVILRPEDSGTRIIGGPGVVISGGVQITGWKRQGRLWVADVPLWNGRPLEFRQLWVNGRKAVRARNVPVTTADGTDPFEQMPRILSVDKARETIYVPRSAILNSQFSILNSQFPELVLHEMWCIANLRVKDIRIEGDSAAITFHNPESHIHFLHPWP